MSLHLIFSVAGYRSALHRAQVDDHLVLLGDGAYQLSLNVDKNYRTSVISDDRLARGVANNTHAEDIDYRGLVALTEQYQPIVSWKD